MAALKLSEQMDRLSRNIKSLKETAINTASSRAPCIFTRAVLHDHLSDLIRDIDSSELGLFTLNSSSAIHPAEKDATSGAPELARVEFAGATPLRRVHRRDDPQPAAMLEPEVYAKAALKYVDRYQSVRSMPRAQAQIQGIVARLDAVRNNITELAKTLDQMTTSYRPSFITMLDHENERIQALRNHINDLKQRKQNAAPRRLEVESTVTEDPSDKSLDKSDFACSPAIRWDTPARTLQFEEYLMEEDVNLGDVTSSFTQGSPVPRSKAEQVSVLESTAQGTIPNLPIDNAPTKIDTLEDSFMSDMHSLVDTTDKPSDAAGRSVEIYPFPVTGDYEPRDIPTLSAQQERNHDIKISSTHGTERIISKFWLTMGEAILPDLFNAPRNKTPRYKQTVSHLQSLADTSVSPLSPSSSSATSSSHPNPAPTPSQVLSAYLILSLIMSPQHALPLARVKEMLVAKASSWGSSSAEAHGTIRILYGCVAKRLLKIDRGGREQVVKFDI